MKSEKKEAILFSLFMDFDIRQFLYSGIIESLAACFNIVILAHPHKTVQIENYISSLKLKKNITLITDEFKFLDNTKIFNRFSKFRNNISRFLSKVFFYSYGNLHKRNNKRRKFYINTIMNEESKADLKSFFENKTVVFLSELISRSYFLRKFFRKFRLKFLTPNNYTNIFKLHNVILLVVCSLGIENDVFSMCEAKRSGVSILSAIQSWDKTSTKGIPSVIPDYVSVWSYIMAEELKIWHDITDEKIFICGVPEWDHYFLNNKNSDKIKIYDELNLKRNKRVIYFALCDPGYHDGNIDAVDYLVDCLLKGLFAKESQVLLRVHPYYFREDFKTQKGELLGHLKQVSAHPDIIINYPFNCINSRDSNKKKANSISELKKIFLISDVCISLLSTQMIEASIFDKPAISIEYGTIKKKHLVVDVNKLIFSDHLMRIYDTNAIYNAKSPDELLKYINTCLDNPGEKKEERKRLIDQEIPVNRGASIMEFANYIKDICGKISNT